MHTSFRHATLAATLFLAAFAGHAKTAAEIYDQAARSTVVVMNLDDKGKTRGMGSGVVFGAGEVVTNCHVIQDARQIKVRSAGQEHPATLRHSDWERDVCSLGVAGIRAPAVVIGSSKTLKVGAKVYAIGAPRGLELTLSDGIVSSLRDVSGGQYIQTTAAISPGSSGGGLFDENGALVGLTTFYLAEGQSLNFAVPVEWVKELATRSAKTAANAQTMTQWLGKTIELENRKDWPALLEHSRRWSQAQPGNAVAWFSLGNAYAEAGQSAQAIEAYQQALRINPEFAEAWYGLGNAYRKAGQSARAIEAFQQALRINPQDAKAWSNLSVAYREAGQSTRAIEATQQALRINPEFAEVWSNLGVAYDEAGQSTKAIEAFQQALRINPEYADAWNNLGVAYGNLGQHAKAIEATQQALRINPEYADAWNNLGVAYALSGQRGKVLEVYQRLKTLDAAQAERFFKNIVMP